MATKLDVYGRRAAVTRQRRALSRQEARAAAQALVTAGVFRSRRLAAQAK